MFGFSKEDPRMLAYRAPSLFQPHRTRQAIRDAYEGRIAPLVGLYMGLSSEAWARWLAPMGFDAIWVDWEHTSCNVETMTSIVHTIAFTSEGRTIPFVRVPGHDHAAIGYALDAGASVIVPQVEDAEQARHVLQATKFGNGGTRSAPPFRYMPGISDGTLDPSLGDIHKNLNCQAALGIQIENVKGIDNLDDILTQCPDIDFVWLGTIDLRVSMGFNADFGGVNDEPEWVAALNKYAKICKKHSKPMAGISLPPMPGWQERARELSFVVVASDVVAMLQVKQCKDQARAALPPQDMRPDAVSDIAILKQAAKEKVGNGVNGHTNGVNGHFNGVNGQEINRTNGHVSHGVNGAP